MSLLTTKFHVFLAVKDHQLAFESQYLQFEYYTRSLGATVGTLILLKSLDFEIMFCLKEDRMRSTVRGRQLF